MATKSVVVKLDYDDEVLQFNDIESVLEDRGVDVELLEEYE